MTEQTISKNLPVKSTRIFTAPKIEMKMISGKAILLIAFLAAFFSSVAAEKTEAGSEL